MDGNELRPLQAPLKKRYREQFRWDSEFESGFLQGRVNNEPSGCVDLPRAALAKAGGCRERVPGQKGAGIDNQKQKPVILHLAARDRRPGEQA